MPTHFKIYDSDLEQCLPSITVLWISSFHTHLLQFYFMSKNDKVKLHKQAKDINHEIYHLKSFVGSVL